MNRYTRDTLLPLNLSYDSEHYLSDKDVEIANIYVYAIESSRSNIGRPKCGDVILIDGKRAHIEKVDYDGIEICLNAYVPFIRCKLYDSNFEISTSTSGGPWRTINANDLEDTKIKEKKTFCFFGNGGPKGNGAVEFEALVNVFKLN